MTLNPNNSKRHTVLAPSSELPRVLTTDSRSSSPRGSGAFTGVVLQEERHHCAILSYNPYRRGGRKAGAQLVRGWLDEAVPTCGPSRSCITASCPGPGSAPSSSLDVASVGYARASSRIAGATRWPPTGPSSCPLPRRRATTSPPGWRATSTVRGRRRCAVMPRGAGRLLARVPRSPPASRLMRV
jgi:hypothetical protein